MKPNGMRAWRKTARRWRRKQNRHWRKTGAPCVADGTGRWYRRQQAFFKQRPAAPSRPFTPRSLVGMTMGARKRAAKVDAWHKAVTYGREVITRALRRCIATDRTKLRVGNVAIEYAQQRRRYRIGERLRPCPGCLACVACGWESDFFLSLNPCCDGSGVIPACPRVNQGKPLAVEPADDLG